MEIIIEPTYDALGQRAAANLLRIVASVKKPLICPTSGSTPAALYRALVQQIEEKKIDYSTWYFVGLDEWAGMDGQDKGSCRDFVNEELFRPLGINEENICFFNGRAKNLKDECTRVEDFIQQHGGITVAVVGLGLNGHVGMNEPGTPVALRSHISQIAEQTKAVGQKYFDTPKDLSQGLTLGLATLLDAGHIFLLANSEKKAAVVKEVTEMEATEMLPATLLKHHAQFKIYIDAAAASLLQ